MANVILTNDDVAAVREAAAKGQGAISAREREAVTKMLTAYEVLSKAAQDAPRGPPVGAVVQVLGGVGGQQQPQDGMQGGVQQPAVGQGKNFEFKAQFDGTDATKTDTFVRQFEAWARATGAGKEQKYFVLTQALVGNAEGWFRFSQNDPAFAAAVAQQNVDELLTALRTRYGYSGDDLTTETALEAAKQKPGESIAAFAGRLEAIAAGAKTQVPMGRLLIRLQMGLRRPDSRAHASFIGVAGTGKTLAELVQVLTRFEATTPEPATGPQQRAVAAVAVAGEAEGAPAPAQHPQQDLVALVSAVAKEVAKGMSQLRPGGRFDGACYVCGKVGHMARRCRERNSRPPGEAQQPHPTQQQGAAQARLQERNPSQQPKN
jgi:hypothetical protein